MLGNMRCGFGRNDVLNTSSVDKRIRSVYLIRYAFSMSQRYARRARSIWSMAGLEDVASAESCSVTKDARFGHGFSLFLQRWNVDFGLILAEVETIQGMQDWDLHLGVVSSTFFCALLALFA